LISFAVGILVRTVESCRENRLIARSSSGIERG